LESIRKIIVGITLTLLILNMMIFTFNFTPENDGGGNIIRVPEDYSTIHEAINAATPGDTIAIAPVTYHESLIIDKPLTILGRKGSRPIFDGGGSGTAITISGPEGSGSIVTYVELVNWDNGVVITNSSDCKVYDVIILNCGRIAIDLKESSTNNTIYNNTMISNANGVRIYTSSRNTVFGNEITQSETTGVYLEQSSNNSICGNKMAENKIGVYLESSSNNMVSGNTISYSNWYGVHLYSSSSNNVISGNYITNSFYHGVYLYSSSNNNTICENNIANNGYGFYLLFSCSSNSIYHNNIVNSTSGQVYNYESINIWDDGYPSGGNYWSDYTGTDLYSGPYQNEDGNDLIGDTPYVIDESNIDNYPLMTQWVPNIPSHMVVAYTGLPSTLDPACCYDTTSAEPILNVYETLIFFDEEKTNQFVPHLATSWSISADGLNYTFTIRQGVKFHNGETLTTEDVEYSFERFMVLDIPEGPAWMFYEPLFDVFGSRDAEGGFTVTGQQIDNAITRNETAVTIHLTKTYPPFMQILSQTWASILCKKWCVEIGDWPGTWNNWTLYNRPYKTAIENQTTEPPGPHTNAMCGTGPFLLDYYQKGVEWSLVKFDGYWGGWPAPGSNGFLQRVTSKKIEDWETRKNMFLEGQLDYVTVPRTSIDEVLGQPGVRCIYPLEDLSCNAMFFTFDISTSSPYLGVPGGLPIGTFNESGIPPNFFSDINVRKGFAYAFNYSKLIEEELRGEPYQPATPIIPGLPFYNPAQEKYSIDLDRAMDCFVAAWGGQVWDNGFNFTICYVEGNSVRQKACEIIKANVESLNTKFHIQIQSIPLNNYSYSSRNNEQPIFIYGWLADFADPHNFVYGFMYSDGAFAPWQTYSNETIDNLMRAGIGTMNETARRQIYYQLQSLYHEDCPSVPLYQPIGRRFERDWVRGWYYNPLLWGLNYFYVQWKGSIYVSTRYSWPMLHHDLSHTGYTESPAPNTNQTQWNYTTGEWVSSSPAVADGKVYIGSADFKIYCLDATTGASIWNYTTGDWVCSSPAVADGRVYVGSADGEVYCLNALTGEKIWNYTTEAKISNYTGVECSSPAVADGRVYVGSIDGNVYCLNATTGALLWNYTAGIVVCSSPAVAGGKVFIGSAGMDFGNVDCLDAITGTHVWNFKTGGSVDSSPTVADGKVYVGSSDSKVYCLNVYTGALIWSYRTSDMVSSSPAVADGKVYVGSYDSKVYCLDASTGASIWNYTTGDWVYSSPAVADGKVYVGSGDSKVYCLNAITGNSIWNYTTGSCVYSSPAVADGMVFIGSSDSIVYAFGSIVRTEDYRTVQEAINVAAPGSTVLVTPGIYHESLIINKTLTIIGLPGSAPIFAGGGSGIAVTLLPSASGSIIAGVVITHWDQGILIIDASDCKIYSNIMSLMNSNGIGLEGINAANNFIYSNIFQENTVAVNLTASSTNNTIYKNIVSFNYIGFNLESGGNIIYANTISENQVGIDISNSNGNIIYHNNFINNNESAKSEQYFNAWDNGYPTGGNYWSDYTGVDDKSGPNQDVVGSDGIGDTNYTIAVNNIDRYPLMKPFNPHDIGIANVITSKTVVGQGFNLRIDLKILNYGIYNETFTITAYANGDVMAAQTITLTRTNSTTITFTWHTTGVAKGNYAIMIEAGTVLDETDTTDNTYLGCTIMVSIPGDVNGDRLVDISDLVITVGTIPSAPGWPNWNPNADINGDGACDISDLVICVGNVPSGPW